MTNHSAPKASAQPAPSHSGCGAERSLRPQREDGARQMAQSRQQDAGIEDGDIDIRITVAAKSPTVPARLHRTTPHSSSSSPGEPDARKLRPMRKRVPSETSV